MKANQDGLYQQVVDWFEQAGSSLLMVVIRHLDYGWAKKRMVQVNEALGLMDAG